MKQYIQNQGCYFHAAVQDTHLAFPTNVLSPRVETEIGMIAKMAPDLDVSLSFNKDDCAKVNIHQSQNQKKV